MCLPADDDRPEQASKALVMSQVVVGVGRTEISKLARKMGIDVDVIFIRSDGFVLGAPRCLYRAARDMYPGQWTHEVWLK